LLSDHEKAAHAGSFSFSSHCRRIPEREPVTEGVLAASVRKNVIEQQPGGDAENLAGKARISEGSRRRGHFIIVFTTKFMNK
jgi:hypothetical protein